MIAEGIRGYGFGTLPSGEEVTGYQLASPGGAIVDVIAWGGIVTSLRVPDREGRLADVVLGFDRLEPYLERHPYFGAITGRIAGRIPNAELLVEGRRYQLARNNEPHHIHGGWDGLDRRLWSAEPFSSAAGNGVTLRYDSPDGEEGFPGNVRFTVTYTLTPDNALIFDTEAISDRPTPISLTQHSYFNLEGEASGRIDDHVIRIDAGEYVPMGSDLILTDRLAPVSPGGNDMREALRFGDVIPRLHAQHGDLYLVPHPEGEGRRVRVVAEASAPKSGRRLTVSTDESFLQFYTGLHLDGSSIGKSGQAYGRHAAFCLECEGYPNGANAPAMDDILVSPGAPRRRRTVYAFGTI